MSEGKQVLNQAKEKGKDVIKQMGKKLASMILTNPVTYAVAAILLIIIIVVGCFVEVEATGSYGNVNSTSVSSTSTGWWWPIGGEERAAQGEKIYATGTPPNADITSEYGEDRGDRKHWAIDMDYSPDVAGENQNIIAVKSGTVTTAGYSDSAGNWVVIDHGDGFTSTYMHMEDNSLLVKAGDTVDYGQVLGLMGNTGNSTRRTFAFCYDKRWKQCKSFRLC